MCKVVYLTSRCFDREARHFRDALAQELCSRNIEVVTKSTCWIKQFFTKHHTYGIAIALDFFRDNEEGCGLTLNRRCSPISRDFAYNLSDAVDVLTPTVKWRYFKFVDSEDKEWYKFFNKVSASTKAIFYLCNKTKESDLENYCLVFNKLVKSFADEIVRCLRSNYDYEKYQHSVRLAKLRTRKRNGYAVVE